MVECKVVDIDDNLVVIVDFLMMIVLLRGLLNLVGIVLVEYGVFEL